jgi:hypothetical protein
MNKALVRLNISIYRLVLMAFPLRFRIGFGDEMIAVFRVTLENAEQQGFWPLAKASLMEMYRLPPVLLRIQWFYWLKEQREANHSLVQSEGTVKSSLTVTRVDGRDSWIQAGLETGFFVTAGAILIALTYLQPNPLTPGWYRDMNLLAVFVLLLTVPVLIVGLHQNLPRWSLPLFGLLLGYCFVAAQRLDMMLMLSVASLTMLLLLFLALFVNSHIRPLPAPIQRWGSSVWPDWSRLSFGLYGCLPLIIIVAFDDSHLNNQTPFLAISVLFMVLGALTYTRIRELDWQIFALLAGMTLSLLPALLDLVANMGGITLWISDSGRLGEIGWLIQLWLLMMALILSPVIITFFLRSPDHEIVA